MMPVRSRQPCEKVNINNLPLSLWKFHCLSQTSRPLLLYFHLLTIRTLSNKLNNIFIQAFPPIYLSQIVVNLGRTRINGISGAISLLQDPLLTTLGTHNLPWYFSTPSPFVQKRILFTFEHSPSDQAKWDLCLVSLSPLTLMMINPIGHHYYSFCGIHKYDSQACKSVHILI